jgi:hypothetical protein
VYLFIFKNRYQIIKVYGLKESSNREKKRIKTVMKSIEKPRKKNARWIRRRKLIDNN